MSDEELKTEWQHRYDTRLAILGCYGEPTPEQKAIARQEADETIRQLNQPDDTLLI